MTSSDNGTYQLSELDRTLLRSLIVGNHVKIFKKREEAYPYVDLEDDNDIRGGTNRDEGPEDDRCAIELVVELADATDDEE